VQLSDKPTRDVYVVRTLDGDRIFDSFGYDTNEYSDCFISKESLPKAVIEKATILVMGTLGLAYPVTGEAMREAVSVAKVSNTTVFVDVNWRPVFWNNPESALDAIMPVLQSADFVKITDEEAEWAFEIPASRALENPCEVSERGRPFISLLTDFLVLEFY
jgi:fructokinase